MEHKFHLTIEWSGGRNDIGELMTKGLQTSVSIPPEMNGPGVGTNPDEMLLGAAATCYIITLAALLERVKIEATLNLSSEGIVDVTNGVFKYVSITHHISICLEKQLQSVKDQALKLAYKAEETCMISKAIRGNVEVKLNVQFLS